MYNQYIKGFKNPVMFRVAFLYIECKVETTNLLRGDSNEDMVKSRGSIIGLLFQSDYGFL